MQDARATGGDVTADDMVDEGVVIEALPRALYRVERTSHERIVAHASRDPRRNFVWILVGDRVSVARAPRNRARGRIMVRVEAGLG